MTAHVSTKSRRVGLPAEAVICQASELTYDAHHFGPLSHGAHGSAGRAVFRNQSG